MPTAGLRQLLRKVVRVDAPPVAARPWAAADNTCGNAWTIRDGDRERKFFFITGCYKSGTHWVQNLLNLHPDVNVKGEFHFESLHRGYSELTQTHWYLSARPRLRPVAEASFQDFVRRMMYAETRDKPGATWLGDRTPRAIGEFLPGAPQINILRDGRDVLVSWNFQHLRAIRMEDLMPEMRPSAERWNPEFREHPERYEHPGTGFLGDEWWVRHHARVWSGIVEGDMVQAPRLRECGVPVLGIRYERLHEDLEGSIGELYGLLALNPLEGAAPSKETRTLPGFEEGVATKFYRKGAVGEWRDYYTDQQKRWFKEEAGATLIRAGYEKDMSW